MKITKSPLLVFSLLLFVFYSCDTIPSEKIKDSESKKETTEKIQEEEDGTIFTQIDSIMNLGDKISMDLIKTLQTELKKNMKDGGPLAAIAMCNTQATPLEEKIAAKYNVKIKRISQNYRSKDNKPSLHEDQLLSSIDYHYQATGELKAFTNMHKIDDKDYIFYYKPMKVKKACLNCHGDISNMKEGVASKLKELYPEDMAVNYKEGDFRGLISIRFELN